MVILYQEMINKKIILKSLKTTLMKMDNLILKNSKRKFKITYSNQYKNNNNKTMNKLTKISKKIIQYNNRLKYLIKFKRIMINNPYNLK